LKDKLKVLHLEEEKVYKTIQNRTQEFDEIQKQYLEKLKLGDKRPHPDFYWKRLLNRNLVEYLLREGSEKSSKELEKSLEKDYNFEIEKRIIENNKNIFEELRSGYVDEALGWCKENRSKLSRTGSNFEFKLILSKFIRNVIDGKNIFVKKLL
jgi:hypothetical protein